MLRRQVIAVLLVLHGLIHLFGFLTSWNIIDVPGISRTPTVFPDEVPIGVIRDLGALWLLGLAAFFLAAYAVLRDHHWWKGVAFGSAVVSLLATLFWIHEAWPGLILNAVIIALIARSWWRAHHPEQVQA